MATSAALASRQFQLSRALFYFGLVSLFIIHCHQLLFSSATFLFLLYPQDAVLNSSHRPIRPCFMPAVVVFVLAPVVFTIGLATPRANAAGCLELGGALAVEGSW